MVAAVGMAAAVTIVTSATASTMETSTAVESSSTTMTTTLGKGSLWQPDERNNADDYEKNSQESGFHHFSSLR
jgi:hypothetical protein